MRYKGIKKAVGEFNSWTAPAIITIYPATGEIECSVGQSQNYVPGYRKLVSKDFPGTATTTIREVKEAIDRLDW